MLCVTLNLNLMFLYKVGEKKKNLSYIVDSTCSLVSHTGTVTASLTHGA